MTHFPICVSLFCAIAISSHATTITVIDTNDSGPGSLRQALAVVNDDDTIDFDPSLKGQTVTLTTAELMISKNITISGLCADSDACAAPDKLGSVCYEAFTIRAIEIL